MSDIAKNKELLDRAKRQWAGKMFCLESEMIAALQASSIKIDRLRGIITELFGEWPEAMVEGMDGFDVQEFAHKHGIFVMEARTVPCCDGCNCSEFVLDGDVSECYRLAEEYRAPDKRNEETK